MLSRTYILIFATMLTLTACSTKVASPQKGGSATISLSETAQTLKVAQPENSQRPTVATFEREIVPTEALPTNWTTVRERYSTTLGEHQTDEARSGFAAVQKTAAVLKAQSPIMYAGLALIIISLAMSYFQAKFPAVFAPGIKIIALTFMTGLILTILPSMTSDRGVLTMALLGGAGVIISFILAKSFQNKQSAEVTSSGTTNNSTTTNNK